MAWTTTRMAISAAVGRVVNTISPSHQPFCKNLAHSWVCHCANRQWRISCTRWWVKTEHLVVQNAWHRRTFSSRVVHTWDITSAHAGSRDMWIVLTRVHLKSHSVISCFMELCLSHSSLRPHLSVHFSLHFFRPLSNEHCISAEFFNKSKLLRHSLTAWPSRALSPKVVKYVKNITAWSHKEMGWNKKHNGMRHENNEVFSSFGTMILIMTKS